MPVAIGRANTSGEFNSRGIGDVEDWFDNVFFDSAGKEYIIGSRMFYAKDVNVNYSMANKINKEAGGINRDRQYKNTDVVGCDISFSFMFSDEIREQLSDPYLFMRDDVDGGNETGKSFYPIAIGGNMYNKCYLSSFSVDIRPFAPIVCSASFKSHDPASGEALKEMDVKDPNSYSLTPDARLNSDSFVYGHTCQLSGILDEVINVDSLSQITFSRTYGRKEIFCLGERLPRESLVTNVENQLVIRGTGLKQLLPSEGIKLEDDIGILLINNNGDRIKTRPLGSEGQGFPEFNVDEGIHIHSGAYVVNESYNVRGGGSVESSVTIKEAIA